MATQATECNVRKMSASHTVSGREVLPKAARTLGVSLGPKVHVCVIVGAHVLAQE